jgi:hypothetical protein
LDIEQDHSHLMFPALLVRMAWNKSRLGKFKTYNAEHNSLLL